MWTRTRTECQQLRPDPVRWPCATTRTGAQHVRARPPGPTREGDRVTDDIATEVADRTLDPALDSAWTRARAALEESVSPQHRAFIGLSRLDAVVGDTALLSVPHQFAKDVIEQRLRETITSALTSELGLGPADRRGRGPEPGRRGGRRLR